VARRGDACSAVLEGLLWGREGRGLEVEKRGRPLRSAGQVVGSLCWRELG